MLETMKASRNLISQPVDTKAVKIPSVNGGCAKLLLPSLTLCDPMDCSHHAPLSMEFSRQECWSGLPFPSPGDLPDQGIEPSSLVSPALQVNSLPLAPPEKTFFVGWYSQIVGFPNSSVGKEYACNAGDPGLIPGLGRSTGEGIGYPRQYSRASLVRERKNESVTWKIKWWQ